MTRGSDDLLCLGDFGEAAHDDGYDSDAARLERMKTNIVSARPWRADMQKLIDKGVDIWELQVCVQQLNEGREERS
jgi:hypothetical protein